VVDAYQIMMHLFTPEQRANYALEKLWKDAEDINLVKLMAEPKLGNKPSLSKKTAKPALRKAVVKKKTSAASKPKKTSSKKKTK
jgi:ribosome-associated protein